ncbi:hypothetical protein DMC01_04590 [Campylobacter troglodytis]|nr:hypothetical protein DMC01_04590 [Campylobacter troglodytis]
MFYAKTVLNYKVFKSQLNLNQGVFKLNHIKNKDPFVNFAKFKGNFEIFFTSPFMPLTLQEALI